MWDLWRLCGEGKQITKDRAAWRVIWPAFNTAARHSHPAFGMADGLVCMAAMKTIAATLSDDPIHVSLRYKRPFGEWLELQRAKLGIEDFDG